MNLSQWKTEFLTNKNRKTLLGDLQEGVQGAPLYAYKMTAEEFVDLQTCLQANLKIYLSSYSIDQICQRSSQFPPLFVLYAAIWWQREYDGSGMSWEPIFSSIGIDYSTLNSNTRSEMIKSGFAQWRLVLNADIGNLKFIGNIACQGGLPLKLIAERHGNLNRLLKRVLKHVVNLAFPDQANVLSIIESNKNELPRSYRQPLIFNLLAEIIITFIHLKTEANLAGTDNPLEKLDRYKANWRDSFPLPMDDKNARGVLERFIQEGVRIRAEKPAFTLLLDRYLQFSDSQFKVVARVDLPKQNVSEESIKKCFGIEDAFITRLMRLQLSNSQQTHQVLIKRLAGQNNFRFDAETTPIFKNPELEHLAELKNLENSCHEVNLLNGYELDEDTPWIFEASDEGDVGKLLKVGAGKFKSTQLYVVVPTNFSVNASIEPISWMQGNEKKCYLVKEALTFYRSEGENYIITPNQSDSCDEEFSLSGNRLWHVFVKPAVAFIGFPQVKKYINFNSPLKKTTSVDALCRNLNNKLLSSNLTTYGPLNLTVREQNSNVWSSKIVVLPISATYKLSPVDENQGVIFLDKWQINNVKCLDEDIDLKVNLEGDSARIQCIYTSTKTPDELINLELFWAGNPKTAVVQLPFPSAGVVAFDGIGQRLNVNKPLSLVQLYGVRITLLSQSRFVAIELTLKDSGDFKVEPFSFRLKRDKSSSRFEIRLIDFKEQISDLLYSVDNLDAKVEFRAKVDGAKDFVLFITKYDIQLENQLGSPTFMIKQSHLSSFANDVIEKCEVMAIRIDDTDDAVDLTQSISEGVCNGIWTFPVHRYPLGCWIIHPSPTSSIQFRPMILPLGEADPIKTNETLENQSEIQLKDALKVANNQEREQCINAVICILVDDFNHEDWEYVEYLADHLGHLNLTSLDLWRLFAKNKHAMAALALRESKLPDQFIHRFATELPFIWEFVSIDAWLDAAFNLKNQLLTKFSDVAFVHKYFSHLLVTKLNSLLVNNASLNMLFEVIKHKNGMDVNAEMQGILNHPQVFGDLLAVQLFKGEQSELQNLLRREDDKWPNKFVAETNTFKRSEHKEFLCGGEFGYKDSVINLPMIAAITALTNERLDWIDNENQFLDIKKIKNFDQDWFASAFDKTIARAITKGYVQLNNK